jgi:esterase
MSRTLSQTLHFLKMNAVKEKYPPLVVLHGLLGNHRNFYTFASKYFKNERTIYLMDLRNHGMSPWNDVMDYESMSDDIEYLRSYLHQSIFEERIFE